MRLFYIAMSCSLFLFAGCNNGNNGNNENAANTGSKDSSASKPVTATEPVRSKLNDEGTQMLMSAVGKYYALKNALVAAKATDADSVASQLGLSAGKLKAYLESDSANAAALKPFVDTIIAECKQVTAVMDESCERKRLPFGTLSSAMYGLLKTVELKHVAIYHEYCPMAFNEKGATWLSDETDIKNPYFGKKMLECGEVTDSLK